MFVSTEYNNYYVYIPQCMLSFLGMTIGFTHVMNTVTESAEYVEVCVNVLIPGEALRNFTVILIPEEGNNLRMFA